MKQLLVFIAVVVMASCAIGQSNIRPVIANMGNPVLYPVGTHYPVLYTGTETLDGGANDVCTTRWLQLSYSYADTTSSAEIVNYRNIGLYDAKFFGVDLTLTSGGDSVAVDTAYFEYAWDTTATAVWDAGHSNFFICEGAYDSTLYDICMWNPVRQLTPAVGYHFPLAVKRGGYIRLVFRHHRPIVDDTFIAWTLWGKN